METLEIPFSKKEFIIKLIKEDIRNNILVSSLESTGLSAYPFFTDLGSMVMQLIGFSEKDRDDDLYQIYESMMEKSNGTNINAFPEIVNKLSEEIYIELLAEKKYREKVKLAGH